MHYHSQILFKLQEESDNDSPMLAAKKMQIMRREGFARYLKDLPKSHFAFLCVEAKILPQCKIPAPVQANITGGVPHV